MSEENKMSAGDRFYRLWAANFKKLHDLDDGLVKWLEFAENADWTILEEAVGLLADQREAHYKKHKVRKNSPKLPELKSMYYDLRDMRKREENDQPEYECFKCKNSGWLKVVVCEIQGKQVVCNPREPFPASDRMVAVVSAPCDCYKGDSRVPIPTRQAYGHNNFGPAFHGPGAEKDYMKKCHELYKAQQLAQVQSEVA